jgi:hypothetical protein
MGESYRKTFPDVVLTSEIPLSFSLRLYSSIKALAASMKLSVSLQLLNLRTVDRTPWTGDQLVARSLLVHKHRKRTHNTNTNIP